MPHDPKTPGRCGTFTLLPPKGPTNPTPEELTWRVAEVAQPEKATLLDPGTAADAGAAERRAGEDAPTS